MSSINGVYIARLNLSEAHNLGVAKKVRSQVAALSQPGVHVDLYFPDGYDIIKNTEIVCDFPSWPLMSKLNYYLIFYMYLALNLRNIKFIYIRYQRSDPIFLLMLACIRITNPSVKIFLELPTYPYDTEWKTSRDRLHGGVDRACRRLLSRFVNYVVTFSRQSMIFGIPTIKTDNGVDVSSISLLPMPDTDTSLRLLGLANLSFWHGYDRVISGIAQYYGHSEARSVVFDIVGSGKELPRLKKEVEKLGLEHRVRFLGPLQGHELSRVMANCHVGISSVGMHRLNTDTSNLKSREFCASGLPFVIGYTDHDFPSELPFVFRAPSNDEPLDISAIIVFYNFLCGNYPNFKLKMREYSKVHLDWTAKLSEVNRIVSQSD